MISYWYLQLKVRDAKRTEKSAKYYFKRKISVIVALLVFWGSISAGAETLLDKHIRKIRGLAMKIGEKDFDCKVKIEASEFKVFYTIKNHTGEDLGIFNRIPITNLDGTVNYSPDSVYVDLENSVLLIRKMALPIPEELSVAEHVVPFVTVVRDGAEYNESFSVPIPVKVCNPYTKALLAAKSPGSEIVAIEKKMATSIQVCIGVCSLGADIRIHPVSRVYTDIFRIWPPGVCVDRQVILSIKFDLEKPILVLDYGTFEMKL